MKIQITELPGGSLELVHRSKLVGLEFEANRVRAAAPKPNKDGWAYEIDTDHAADVLKTAGFTAAAQYYGNLNRYPAMQRLGFCVEIDKAVIAAPRLVVPTPVDPPKNATTPFQFNTRFEALEVD